MTTPDTLRSLRECRTHLTSAREAVLSAATSLTGARHSRAGDLAEQIADNIAYVDRLVFVVLGDLHAEQAAHHPLGDR